MKAKYTRKPRKEELYRLYVEEEKSVPMIADMFGACDGTVYRWMKSAHIECRLSGVYSKKPCIEEMHRLYVEEYTTAKHIGEMYGVSESAVFDWLKSYGIDRRSLQSAQLKEKVVPTGDQLYKLYIVDGCTLSAIGDVYDVHAGTVGRWIGKSGIRRRTNAEAHFKGKRRPDRNELYKLYIEDIMSTTELGEMFGCPAGTIYRWLMADGIPVRPHGVSKMGGRVRPDKEMLRKMHIDERKPLTHIADIFETNRTTVRNWLRDDDTQFMPITPPGAVRKQPYCVKWNEKLREKIRNKFDRKCFICGKTEEENGAKLSVHHTNSGKMCMCDYACELVPLCKTCHGKTNSNRFAWFSFIMCKLLSESSAQYVIIDSNI
jgi:transposase